MKPTINHIELPLAAYERFRDLTQRILRFEIDSETARYETIDILSPYWDHTPEPWERTEISLKKVVSSLNTTKHP